MKVSEPLDCPIFKEFFYLDEIYAIDFIKNRPLEQVQKVFRQLCLSNILTPNIAVHFSIRFYNELAYDFEEPNEFSKQNQKLIERANRILGKVKNDSK